MGLHTYRIMPGNIPYYLSDKGGTKRVPGSPLGEGNATGIVDAGGASRL